MNAAGGTWTRLWDPRRWWQLLDSRDDAVRREAWGYAFWVPVIFLLFLPAELIPAFSGAVDWPTFSTTIGHLEYLWSPTALFVVALMVFTAVNAVARRRHREAARVADRAAARPQGTYRLDAEGGRIVRNQVPHDTSVRMRLYLPASAALIAAGSAPAFVFGGYWIGAYVLWSLVAFFVLVLPSILAFFLAKHVPFPTLFATVANLQGHVHMVGTAVLAFLVALGIHLGFYPWPNTAHVLQADHRIAPSVTGSAVRGGVVTVSGTVENCARPEKVVVRSRAFGAVAVPVHEGRYSVRVPLTAAPTAGDMVTVFCGRPEIGAAPFP